MGRRMSVPATIKPEDVKIGNRVRITVEGVVIEDFGLDGLYIKLTGGDMGTRFIPSELAHATIERIPEVIEVGDTVSVRNWNGPWIVKAIDAYAAWVRRDDGYRISTAISALTLIRKAVKW